MYLLQTERMTNESAPEMADKTRCEAEVAAFNRSRRKPLHGDAPTSRLRKIPK